MLRNRSLAGLALAGLFVLVIGAAIRATGGRSDGSTSSPSVAEASPGLGPAAVLDRREAGAASLVTTDGGILVALTYGMGDTPTCPAGPVGIIDTDGTLAWRTDPPGQLFTVAGLATSPTVIADGVGTSCTPAPYVSTDAGMTWQARERPVGFTLPMPWLALDPVDPDRVFAWTTGRLFVSADRGRSWASRPSAVRPFTVDPDGRLLGWSTRGIMASMDRGAVWTAFGASGSSTVEPRAGVAWGDSVVLAGSAGLVRVDRSADPVAMLVEDALAVSVGGDRRSQYLTALVVGADGTTAVVLTRDGQVLERTVMPDGLGLSARPGTASIAATADQIVVAFGDGQTVALIRVAVQPSP